ncbi:pleckstrin homology domain-containing family G member 3 isoform X1 [Carcharodon carcharias]|uniref:pleckstrin homology domain-containing family G member 3 isoform X1 n=2 Tax=Carcharodon carcharias TaxID=13397 RepID=UPI001B7DE8D5|nr:pleckstrin homology domain-containing family G member 3 isoform X1 [Carcharodon carcharias]XP_041070376.1 pleckstrin homology domain-containing family G member 3 isoform X1 [Carcharodon carcharias]
MPEGSLCSAKEAPAVEESPRTSSASSLSSHDRMSTVTASTSSTSVNTDCSDNERPVSAGSSGSLQDFRGPFGTPPPGNQPLEARTQMEECVRVEQAPPLHALKADRACNNNNNTPDRMSMDVNFLQVPLSPIATRAMAPNPKLSYVDRVVMEIIETERMYVQDLRSIIEDYLGCIIDALDLPIRPEHVSALFGNIEDIYEFNSDLLQDLDRCHHDPVAIARCFVDKSQDFDIYTQYCTNYPNSVAALTECMRNKILAKFFRERQSTLKRYLPLGSYLLKPVQRILKYHLLLQEIAKHFDASQEGYEVIEEAIDTMTGVAWYINDMKRKHEHAIRLQEVQSLLINWNGPDLTTYGELVLEGTFRIHRAKNERTLFLFDKVLLLAKKRGEHFIYKTHILCSALMLIESTRDSLCFGLSDYKNPKQQHTVQAKTVEEKRLWTHHIKRLILDNHHAIIPQKAKEAILEMDSYYPSKYRYSPERSKKSMSTQPMEEFLSCRRGRRQSEPTKQILKSLVQSVSLKHAGSDGELLGNKDSLNSMTGVSTRGPSTSEAEGERHDSEDILAQSKDSLELLNASDSEETARGTEFVQEGLEPEEELMIEGDQVADFASSLLAAISCWHYRARALLSAKFSMTEDPVELQEVKGCKRQNSQPSGNAEKRRGWDIDTSASEELAPDVEPISVQQLVTEACQSALEEIQSDSETAHSPEEAKEPDEASEDIDVEGSDPGQGAVESATDSFNEADEEPKHFSSEESTDEEEQDRDSPSILPPSVLGQASLIAGHFMNSRSRRNSLAADDSRSYGCPTPKATSRQSSLENGDKVLRNSGTFDTNANCKVSVSQVNNSPEKHFEEPDFSGLEDGSSEMDRNIPRRRDSTLSRRDRLLIEKIKSYYDNAEHEDANFSIRRRESLSYIPAGLVRNSISKLNSQKKEEDLREATLRRRFAASSATVAHGNGPPTCTLLDLPDAITQTSSRSSSGSGQISEPQQPVSNNHVEESLPLDFSRDTSIISQDPIAEDEFRPSVDMIKIWQEMESMSDTAAEPPKRAEQKHETALRPNSEMLKKREVENTEQCQIKELSNGRIIFGLDFNEPLVIVEDSDLSAIMEESPLSSPARFAHESGLQVRPNNISESGDSEHAEGLLPAHKSAPLYQRPLCVQLPKCSEAENKTAPPGTSSNLPRKRHGHLAQSTRPHIAQAGSRAQSEELLREVTEKVKTKVYQLARIYSQRIKNSRPVVQKRGQHLEEGLMNDEEERGKEMAKLPNFQEDKKEIVVDADKPKMTLSLPSYEHVIIQEQVFLAPLMEEPSTPSPSKDLQAVLPPSPRISSPRRSVISPNLASPVRSHSRSPLSPTEMETFLWPDVRELRSKYASGDGQFAKNLTQRAAGENLLRLTEGTHSKLGRVAKSMSMPNGMMEGRMSHFSSPEQEDRSKPSSAKVQVSNEASGAGARKQLHSDSSIHYLRQAAPESSFRNHVSCSRTASSDCRCAELSSCSDCKHCHFTKDAESTQCISSELTLQDHQKVIIVENLPWDRDGLSSHRNDQTAKDSSSGGEGYIQIRSPTSHEKISIRAVVERCRAYQESEEYKMRQESEGKSWRPGTANPMAKLHSSKGAEKEVSSTKWQSEPRKEMSQLSRRTDLGQQGLVKNLRDKFQSLSSAR